MLLTGCAVPLGPGFRLLARQMVLGGAPAASAPVHMRVVDQMENTGNRALIYLDVSLSTAQDPARNRLTIRIDGKSVVPVAASGDPPVPFRVPFDPPWPARQRREIILEYDLAADPINGGVASVTADGFYLADPHALPSWIVPLGVFSKRDVLNRDERFEITLPADFRVVASGKRQQRRAPDGGFLYRFQTSVMESPSFVIAGRYLEQVVQTSSGSVVFWTFRPLDPNVAQMAAGRLATARAALASRFGSFQKPGPLRIIEAPDGLLAPDAAAPGEPAMAASFPEGLLLGQRAFAQGISSEPVLRAAEAEMVRIWFGWRVPLGSDTDTLLGRGLGLLAGAMAAEAVGGQPARRLEIVRLLAEYDRAPAAGDDGSLLRPPQQCTPQQLAANALKAALFLADLNDLAGQDKFERSMQRLQAAMTGRELVLSLDDFRASLEISTGTSMAGKFREWLNRPGVPDDFRERYSSSLPVSPAVAPRPPSVVFVAPQERTAVTGLFRRHP